MSVYTVLTVIVIAEVKNLLGIRKDYRAIIVPGKVAATAIFSCGMGDDYIYSSINPVPQ